MAILPISERFSDYANSVLNQLAEHDIRGFVDERAETIGRKIRDTELKRVPFMIIIGEKEVEEGRISIRRQGEGQGQGDKGSMSVDEFVDLFKSLL